MTKNLFNDLESYLDDVKKKFLQIHIANQLSRPEEYNLDVRSFCVLSHAAFEDFIESIVLQVMNFATNKYINENKVTKPLVTLMHFVATPDNLNQTDAAKLSIADVDTVFEYVRGKLEEAKSKFSIEVFNNHGVSLKYLVKLLLPVSIDIPRDVIWHNSLDALANARGSYAHKFQDKGRLQQSISPTDALKIVDDCLAMCAEINKRADSLMV